MPTAPTSKKAREDLEDSGKMDSKERQMLQALLDHGPMTVPEYARRMGIDYHGPTSTQNHLRSRGLVRFQGTRLDEVRGTRCGIMVVVDREAAEDFIEGTVVPEKMEAETTIAKRVANQARRFKQRFAQDPDLKPLVEAIEEHEEYLKRMGGEEEGPPSVPEDIEELRRVLVPMGIWVDHKGKREPIVEMHPAHMKAAIKKLTKEGHDYKNEEDILWHLVKAWKDAKYQTAPWLTEDDWQGDDKDVWW